jgi:hypothetical protein
MQPLGHKVKQGNAPHYWHHQEQEMNQMKRAELIIGKSYYMHESANWRDKVYADNSYAKTADIHKRRKVVIVETQLKTEQEKKYRNRDVLIQNSNGDQKWVALNHIRIEWIEAVSLITKDWRRARYDDRGRKYDRHLQRKFAREQFAPALKTMLEEIERVTGEKVYSWDKMESLDIKTIKTLTQALSFIKTDLQAVAS